MAATEKIDVGVVTVRNQSRGGTIVLEARWCASFVCKLRGLSLRRSFPDGLGLILVESGRGRLTTSIHMFGMFFDLGVLWVDANGAVVDARRARPWRIYVPSAPAMYTLEGPTRILGSAAVGDRLEFDHHAPST